MKRRPRRRLFRRPTRQEAPRPILKTPQEIQILREAGRIVGRVHQVLKEAIRPGVSTWELDQLAAETLHRYNAESAFLGYRGYPAHICTSINEELVHGIPSKERILREGDIISIDVGSYYRGFVVDSAWTYPVGSISEEAQALLEATEGSLYAGIEQAVAGNRIRDVSRAVQEYVESRGFYVVREYAGHGVGRSMHEPPQVLNYVTEGGDSDLVMEPGLVFALEPMVQAGTWETRVLADGWTVVSKDGSLTAHFEHTIAVTGAGPKILTLP